MDSYNRMIRGMEKASTRTERLAEVRPPLRAPMIAYLDRKRASCQPKTVSGIATRKSSEATLQVINDATDITIGGSAETPLKNE